MSLIADALKKVYEKNIRFNKTANPREFRACSKTTNHFCDSNMPPVFDWWFLTKHKLILAFQL